MELGSPEAANRRLANSMFLNGHADTAAFNDLIVRIRAMANLQHKTIKEPDINQAGAWQAAYRVYEQLTVVQNKPADPEVAMRRNESAADELLWDWYIRRREDLIRQGLSDVYREYLGLHPTDIGEEPMITDARFGRIKRTDWKSVANRIDGALKVWENMTPDRRKLIPQEVERRRSVAAFNALVETVAELKNTQQEILNRLSMLEAKNQEKSTMARDDIGTVRGLRTNSINRGQAAGSASVGYGACTEKLKDAAKGRIDPNGGSRGSPLAKKMPKTSLPDRVPAGGDGGAKNMKRGMTSIREGR
jgi:hypothetical protein